MLSMSLHHHHSPAFGQYIASNTLSYEAPSYNHHHNHHHQHVANAGNVGHPGLETLGHHSAAYALHYPQQQQQQQVQHHHLSHQRQVLPEKTHIKLNQHRHHPYPQAPIRSIRDAMTTEPVRRSANATAPVRRRISRACDQCNQLRTKCDGKTPCAHCQEFSLKCEYNRERKKRGKASRKDLAAQKAAAASTNTADGSTAGHSPAGSPLAVDDGVTSTHDQDDAQSVDSGPSERKPPEAYKKVDPPRSHPDFRDSVERNVHNGDSNSLAEINGTANSPALNSPAGSHSNSVFLQSVEPHLTDISNSSPMPSYNHVEDYDSSLMQQTTLQNGHSILRNAAIPQHVLRPENLQGFGDPQYNMMSPGGQTAISYGIATGSPISNHLLGTGSVADSPHWQATSPDTDFYAHSLHPIRTQFGAQQLKYPVLGPVLRYLDQELIPESLACELLDVYFESSSNAYFQPHSPYVLASLLRKHSFVSPTKFRLCTPGLLASMLWVGAHTSESPVFTKDPQSRLHICQYLFELALQLLRPLVHSPVNTSLTTPTQGLNDLMSGAAIGTYGTSETDSGARGACGGIDEVITYIHFATITSASEYKTASLRWWNAAWSLARELKLGKELLGHAMMDHDRVYNAATPKPNEEHREERRRVWWLLFAMDRHLALCYNKPLFLQDQECELLYQPVDDCIWQGGGDFNELMEARIERHQGPPTRCTGHSIFGYFLPLMTILGTVVNLQGLRNHPRWGNRGHWDEEIKDVQIQLVEFQTSIQEFGNTHLSSFGSPNSSLRHAEAIRHTKLVMAYSRQIFHTLHFLLHGKWDPLTLLDDNDLWISTEEFQTASMHAVFAAHAVAEILVLDPELDFMPFFFGIYLLQGSSILLLYAEKLQGDVDSSVVEACEISVRAHEACVVTLNTEYQRNFRKVMRSALAQVSGHGNTDEQQQRRRDALSRYRWTRDGTGLAL